MSFPACRLSSRTIRRRPKPCSPYWTGRPIRPSSSEHADYDRYDVVHDDFTANCRNEVETQILTPEASDFLTKLAREFEARRQELLARRRARQKQIDTGQFPDFLPETAHIRQAIGRLRRFRTICSIAAWRSPARGPQDDHQCAELRRQRLHGGL